MEAEKIICCDRGCGNEGMLFNRYTADIMRKNVDVPWKELM